ncbi:MAG: tRNA (adenosine(37)-N6)-threonylcarbamoyltransferase complex dimerization subunit type 1 TsaB [Bacteroidota bacterium]
MILSLETATTTCSVALINEGDLIAEQNYYLDKSHSSLLPAIIEELLVNCNVQKMQLQAVALSDGPGSYTGLRIGSSIAKGLCFALDIPLIAINTLKALAFSVVSEPLSEYIFCPMLDARRMEVYTSFYDFDLNELLPTSAIPLERDSFESFTDKKLLLFGNGAGKTKELFQGLDYVHYLDDVQVKASAVGLLANERFEKEAFENLAYYEPNYFKEFKAIKSKPLL